MRLHALFALCMLFQKFALAGHVVTAAFRCSRQMSKQVARIERQRNPGQPYGMVRYRRNLASDGTFLRTVTRATVVERAVARIERKRNPGQPYGMVRYRRNFASGGTFFLTATLADRNSSALTDHAVALRAAVKLTRRQHPFTIDAVVVLPDHFHMIMTLPARDANFSNRLSLIKRRFTTAVLKTGVAIARHPNGELALWQRRFLGAYHPGREGLRTPRRLCSLQSGQAPSCRQGS